MSVAVAMVSVRCNNPGLQLRIRDQQLCIPRVKLQRVIKNLQLLHGAEQRCEGSAHLAKDTRNIIQLAVLFQITQSDSTADLIFALIGQVLAAQYLKQSGFSGAVFAHDADPPAPFPGGIDVVLHHRVATAFS